MPTTLEHAPTIRPAPARLLRARWAGLPPWVLVLELFIGLGWLRAAAEKLIDPAWWRGEKLAVFVDEHLAVALPLFKPFLSGPVSSNLVLISVVVVVLQVLAGVSLVSGYRVGWGVGVGMALNVSFVLAGAVNPSVFYLVCQLVLVLWLAENQGSRQTRRRQLSGLGRAGIVMAGLAAPFVATVHPAEVIDDPAMMLVFLGLLAAMSAHVARLPRLPARPTVDESDHALR